MRAGRRPTILEFGQHSVPSARNLDGHLKAGDPPVCWKVFNGDH